MKFFIRFDLRQSGFSLVEILVAAGLIGVIMMAMASTVLNTQREQQALEEKMITLEVKNNLQIMLTNTATCTSQLLGGTPSPIDISDATTTTASASIINFASLRIGPNPTSPLIASTAQSLPGQPIGQMVVSAIQLANIRQTGNPNEYVGDISITLNPSTLKRPLRAISSSIVFVINPPATAATVQMCGSAGGACATLNSGVWAPTATVTCGPGFRMTGSSCDFRRGGDGRIVNPIECTPNGNQVTCRENNSGDCRAYAICCP